MGYDLGTLGGPTGGDGSNINELLKQLAEQLSVLPKSLHAMVGNLSDLNRRDSERFEKETKRRREDDAEKRRKERKQALYTKAEQKKIERDDKQIRLLEETLKLQRQELEELKKNPENIRKILAEARSKEVRQESNELRKEYEKNMRANGRKFGDRAVLEEMGSQSALMSLFNKAIGIGKKDSPGSATNQLNRVNKIARESAQGQFANLSDRVNASAFEDGGKGYLANKDLLGDKKSLLNTFQQNAVSRKIKGVPNPSKQEVVDNPEGNGPIGEINAIHRLDKTITDTLGGKGSSDNSSSGGGLGGGGLMKLFKSKGFLIALGAVVAGGLAVSLWNIFNGKENKPIDEVASEGERAMESASPSSPAMSAPTTSSAPSDIRRIKRKGSDYFSVISGKEKKLDMSELDSTFKEFSNFAVQAGRRAPSESRNPVNGNMQAGEEITFHQGGFVPSNWDSKKGMSGKVGGQRGGDVPTLLQGGEQVLSLSETESMVAQLQQLIELQKKTIEATEKQVEATEKVGKPSGAPQPRGPSQPQIRSMQ